MFEWAFPGLAAEGGVSERPTIDSTHLKAHRTAASFAKGASPRCIGRTRAGLSSKRQAVCDGQGRPVAMLLNEGQMSDHRGAAPLLPVLPPARELLGERGHDSNYVRTALPGAASHPTARPLTHARCSSRTTQPSTASASTHYPNRVYTPRIALMRVSGAETRRL